MNESLRNSLWNVLQMRIFDPLKSVPSHYSFCLDDFFKKYYLNFLKKPIYEIGRKQDEVNGIAKIFRVDAWYLVYDVVEFVYNWFENSVGNRRISYSDGNRTKALKTNADLAKNELNSMLEREGSVFRLVGSELAQITSEQEIDEIESALKATTPIGGAHDHLSQALAHLTDRESPDFRNSIKESISAVESICKVATNAEAGSLGGLLKRMEEEDVIHPAMKGAYSKLYGFTSDSGGIRHAMTEKEEVTYKDARFMLIVCSAFINFVIETVGE
ncbi:hypothetical protein SAMN05661010_00053 [Modicisalibacter muralis]|uniref:HEPN AbiJ-N-terminal domain-containing protein n=2 Tax=Modicisalibacter muralis TaxID=119000 RepID=A0A1G9EP61_9GAMM|nr:hypothetical protein SAMN05661010_00053 [Halomonas muralis]